jgi:hypothetical protein
MLGLIVKFAGVLARTDNGEAVCEDAVGVRQTKNGLRVAVSDGASDGFVSGTWAQGLCKTYCNADEDGGVLPRLDTARTAWQVKAKEAGENSPLPWFALEAKQAGGASAAFLGVTLEKWENGEAVDVRAVSVGDCCLFLVQGDLHQTFPMNRSDDFNSTPALLFTHVNAPPPPVHEFQAMCKPGDELFLATDALAQWIMSEFERSQSPLPWLRAMGQNREAFAKHINELRDGGRLRQDDVALVWVQIGNG